MHFEMLAEDKSGTIALEIVMKKILGANGTEHSWRTHSYKGAGRIPKNMHSVTDPSKRILLDRLPQLLQGYGKSHNRNGFPDAVIVVVDLDRRDCKAFKRELLDVLNACNPRPRTLFRIAVEESEAWLLGDRDAVKAAYPQATDAVLNEYVQDSICDTWELLADAIHPGGASALGKWPASGQAKCEWAEKIAPRMDVDCNRSRSFQVFRNGVRRLAGLC